MILKYDSMKKIFTHSIASCLLLLLAINTFGNTELKDFCLDANLEDADAQLQMMCLTAPVIFCPPTFFGCPSDNIDPSFTGEPTTMPGDANCPEPIVSYTDVVVMDTPCLKIIHRTWNATYPAGSASIKLHSSCQQTIYLEDSEAPTINNCPSDMTLDLSVDCDSTAIWSLPTADDNCNIQYFTTTHFSGASFPQGTTTVTYTAQDYCGLQTTCSFNVSVINSCCNAPVISCPSNTITCPVNGVTDPSATGFATAVPTDVSCGNPIITYTDIVTSQGSCNGEMTIQRTWTATDASDNSQASTCIQIIDLQDTEAPQLVNIPNDITVSGNGTGCSVQVFWEQPLATDNCGIVTINSTHDSGMTFNEGSTVVTYSAVDNCGLAVAETFNVTVICNCDALPVVTCPTDYIACPTGAYPEPADTGPATAVAGDSNCQAPVITYNDIIVSSGPCSSEYNIVRTWTATDPNNAALSVSCDQSIELEDNGAPVITNMPTDITLYKKGVHCLMPVTWAEPTITDDCSLSSSESNIPNGSMFNAGTTTVIYTAVDVCGNVTTASFNITIECNTCNTPPVITCPDTYVSCPGVFIPEPSVSGDAIVTSAGGTCGTPIVYFSDSFTAFGNCPGSFYVNRTWTAFDQYNPNLTASCIQQIVIDDTTPPTISGTPDDITVNAVGNGCQLAVTWVEPTASDDCGISDFTVNHAMGSVFSEGTTAVTYTATDNCGNTITSSFNVTVACQACNTNPVLTCPADYFGCPGTSTDPTITGFATAFNNGQDCAAPIITYTDTNINAPSCNGAITIERLWTATDPSDSNLQTSCLQYIYLADSTPPTFTSVPQDIILAGTGANCTMQATWNIPTFTDNCGNVSLSSNYSSGALFGEGTTVVTYTATDGCGNVSSISFNITVSCATCNVAPLITCPANVVACPGASTDPIDTGSATATLNGPNCNAAPTLGYTDAVTNYNNCSNNSAQVLRTWTAVNPTNTSLSTSCVQTIELIDNVPPTISNVPQDITVNGSGTGCSVPVSWAIPSATDNCGASSISSNYTSGSSFGVGTTSVVFNAVDGCGNVSTASFNVTVNCTPTCNTPPAINCPTDYWACPQGGIPGPVVSGSATATSGGSQCGVPVVSYTDLIVGTGPCSSSKVIKRTWTATDSNNPSLVSSCDQFIYLEDNSAPSFTYLPQDITVNGTGNNCQVPVNWTSPSASDNCGAVTISSNYTSGSYFTAGTTTVVITATDVCGNAATANFTVTVICAAACTQAPTISCPPAYVSCPVPGVPGPAICGSANAYPGGPDCGTPIVSFNDVIVSNGPCPNAKVVQRTWVATDQVNNLSATCVQSITLEDVVAPLLASCPIDQYLIGMPVTTGSGSGCVATAYWTAPTVSDNCGVSSLVATDTAGNEVDSGDDFPEGTSIITYTATDVCGNTSTCQFEIFVDCDGSTGNSIVCPDDIVVQCGGNGGSVVNWPAPTYNGQCGSCNGDPIPGFVYMGSWGGSEYYCSTDPASWANANQTCLDNGGYLACINSQEENAFLASILTLQSAWIGLGDPDKDGEFTWGCGDPLTYTNWYPGQPNNYAGNQDCVEMLNNGQWNDQYPYYLLEFIMEKPCSFIHQVSGPKSGDFLQGGTYTVEYETNDACGPVERCSFTITVEDGLDLVCPEDIIASAAANSSGTVVSWNLPEVSSCCSDCNTGGGFIPGFVYMGSFNGHHYYCSTGTDTWTNAQANCVANGGHLAVINNAAENAYLANILTLQSAWIGANDVNQEGTFEWVNGDPFGGYTNWYVGQPNNYNNNQHYVEMLNDGQWNDQYGYYSLEYIMEIPSCLTLQQIGGPAPGSVLAPGSQHTVTYQATDGCGNVKTCSFDITVEATQDVCNPGGDKSDCQYIQTCKFGIIDHTSGDNGGYADFTNICTYAGPTDQLSLQLVPGFGSCGPQKVYWTVWIDLNLDGDFYDANEFVAYGCGQNSLNGVITFPSALANGTSTMRVMMKLGGYADDPCQHYPEGETEDYCIELMGSKVLPTNVVVNKRHDLGQVELTEERVEAPTIEIDYAVKVYPNPVSEMMTIQSADFDKVVSMKLYALNGQEVLDIREDDIDQEIRINVRHLATGMYSLRCLFVNGEVSTKKVIIQN